MAAEATTCVSTVASSGAVAPSSDPLRNAISRSGKTIPRAAMIAATSAAALRPGTVGPEATSPGASPGTSETTKLQTRAGAASAASRPPFIPEKHFRMSFITPMGAPEASSASFSA